MKLFFVAALALSLIPAKASDLYRSFVSPPLSAAPHVWWHWMNGNISKEGITADLEAMRRIGIAGAHSIDCGCDIPRGDVAFASPQWYEMALHAHNEAKRLGLELCFSNCSGYSASGGPWVKVEDSMKHVVVEECTVRSGEEVFLPVRSATHGHYRDIAVAAFRTPAKTFEITTGHCAERSVDSKKTRVSFTYGFEDEKTFDEIKVCYKPRNIIWDDSSRVDILVETSNDGRCWKEEAAIKDDLTPNYTASTAPHYHKCGTISAKFIRIVFKYRVSRYIKTHPVVFVGLGSYNRVKDLPEKIFAVAGEVRNKFDKIADRDTIVKKEDIVIIDPKFDSEGRLLNFVVPGESERWTVLRVGYASTGSVCSPASDFGKGFEVDKLNSKALDRYFDGHIAKLVKVCGIDPSSDPMGRAGFNMVLVDSWEVGSQNWTDGFEKTFEKICSYPIFGFLPCFAGFVVGSSEETEKFYDDFRKVIEELFAKNYVGRLSQRCREAGIMLSVEPYSNQPCSTMRYGYDVDCPMSEFWWKPPSDLTIDRSCKYVSSLGHILGRKYLGAESFTTFPEDGRWTQTPSDYKAIGDMAFANGVNRIVYHRYAHQPWTSHHAYPGMTMGYWGTHFERTQTWWDFAFDWIKYQTRCQYMLQEGVFKADFLLYTGSSVPQFPKFAVCNGRNVIPEGYAFDFIEKSLLDKLEKTDDGFIKAPGGTKYRFIAVPDDEKDIPATGFKTVRYSDILKTLEEMGVKPSLQDVSDAPSTNFSWISRSYAEGRSEAWFVANGSTNHVSKRIVLSASVRSAPQLWCAETGKREALRHNILSDGRVEVSFDLAPLASAFIVFDGLCKEPLAAVKKETISEYELKGAWTVKFKEPRRGTRPELALDSLQDLSTHSDNDIRFFSGVMVYEKTFSLPLPQLEKCDSVMLDLGDVAKLCRVKVNGEYCPIALWKKPYCADITSFAKKSNGLLTVEVEVANTWVNRIVGDIVEGYKSDVVWKRGFLSEIPRFIKEGRPSPTGRHCFYTYRHFRKRDARNMPQSGLLGPVKIQMSSARIESQTSLPLSVKK